ncbi:hypothetical protein NL676_030294, partial [Syzygium grande]
SRDLLKELLEKLRGVSTISIGGWCLQILSALCCNFPIGVDCYALSSEMKEKFDALTARILNGELILSSEPKPAQPFEGIL